MLSNKSAARIRKTNAFQSLWQTNRSRGATLVRQALEQKKGIGTNDRCNFIQRVEMSGVRVVYIEDVRIGVRKLRAPFIKVEDHSRNYRPLNFGNDQMAQPG